MGEEGSTRVKEVLASRQSKSTKKIAELALQGARAFQPNKPVQNQQKKFVKGKNQQQVAKPQFTSALPQSKPQDLNFQRGGHNPGGGGRGRGRGSSNNFNNFQGKGRGRSQGNPNKGNPGNHQ